MTWRATNKQTNKTNKQTNAKVMAVIPVRAGSRRLPNKNILPFGNSNLLVHKIRQLKAVPNINEVLVASDSDEMLEMAKAENVSIFKRAPEFCDEKTKSFNDVVENIALNVECDVLMWAPCVCPLTQIDSYKNAIDIFFDKVLNKNSYDSVISGKRFKEYLFDENGPLNWKPEHHVPSQLLPEWKTIVNGFYIAKREDMINWKYLYGKNPYIYILDKKEAVDIDDKEDFEVAKALLEVK